MIKNRGFTLIELLVVIMIIMLLAGLLVGVAQKARERGNIAAAQSGISSLETALSMYEVDIGSYPTSGNPNLITELTVGSGQTNWRGPYIQLRAEDLVAGIYIDPWGNAYNYTRGGPNNGISYVDISSNGPDGAPGGGDDIDNW